MNDRVPFASSDRDLGVLVGVDGSAHARCALHFAAVNALSSNTALTVVAVYRLPPMTYTGEPEILVTPEARAERDRAETVLDDALKVSARLPGKGHVLVGRRQPDRSSHRTQWSCADGRSRLPRSRRLHRPAPRFGRRGASRPVAVPHCGRPEGLSAGSRAGPGTLRPRSRHRTGGRWNRPVRAQSHCAAPRRTAGGALRGSAAGHDSDAAAAGSGSTGTRNSRSSRPSLSAARAICGHRWKGRSPGCVNVIRTSRLLPTSNSAPRVIFSKRRPVLDS